MKISTTHIVKRVAIASAVASLFVAGSVFAETSRPNIYSASSTRPFASTTRPFNGMGRFASSTEARHASSTEVRIDMRRQQGDQLVNQRITSLNTLLNNIQKMVHLSDSDRNSVEASINADISKLNYLKIKIDADTSTTSLKDDLSSITKAYRVYVLAEPQVRITTASDRILSIINSLSTISAKVNARLASSTQASSTDPAIQGALADFNAQITDAAAQAHAAITEVAGLQPDNGDATIAASNKAALQDARAKILAAEKDLKTAQSDIRTIVQKITHKQ